MKEYREWMLAIFARDYYTCVLCGYKGPELEADHFPEQFIDILITRNIKTVQESLNCADLWSLESGRTLCEDCHKNTDSYGARPKESFEKIEAMSAEELQIMALQKRNHYLEARNSDLQAKHAANLIKIKQLKAALKRFGEDWE